MPAVEAEIPEQLAVLAVREAVAEHRDRREVLDHLAEVGARQRLDEPGRELLDEDPVELAEERVGDQAGRSAESTDHHHREPRLDRQIGQQGPALVRLEARDRLTFQRYLKGPQ